MASSRSTQSIRFLDGSLGTPQRSTYALSNKLTDQRTCTRVDHDTEMREENVKTYTARLEKEKDGRWTGELEEEPRVHTWGKTVDQARQAREQVRIADRLVIDADGIVATAPAIGPAAIRALVARSLQVPLDPPLPKVVRDVAHLQVEAVARGNPYAPAIGNPAPAFALPDLDGRLVESSAFAGAPVVLLFWDPECSFCWQMRPDLATWASRSTPESPRLVVITTGNRDRDQWSPPGDHLLLDPAFSTARRYGAAGTPMAVLIDSSGRVASSVAAGAPAIWALLGAYPQTRRSHSPVANANLGGLDDSANN